MRPSLLLEADLGYGDVVGGIPKVAEHLCVDLVGVGLRHVGGRGNGQQGNILEDAQQVEVEYAAHGTGLAGHAALHGIARPVEALDALQQFVDTVDGGIVADPERVMQILLRVVLAHVEAVDNGRVAGIVVARAAEAFVGQQLREIVEGDTVRCHPS